LRPETEVIVKFRSDINGLRALAVIAVVIYHFEPSWMPGGFAGVDVFFVISGYLMTGIIFKGIEQENFSIIQFYKARAIRIIPALAVMCFILLLFGWFFTFDTTYATMSKHIVSSLTFLSNIVYWGESGYFDASSHQKWLLHTWSLSVEWQFYLIYPLILLGLRKCISIETMKKLVVVGTFLGTAFCIFITFEWPDYKWANPSFYMLPTRAWEMMLGGVAFLYPMTINSKKKIILELLGLILVIGTYFIATADIAWPGYAAIFPVLGTYLIIIAQRENSFVTQNYVFQKLGAWSYSIYLWHWPLVVYMNTYLEVTFLNIGMLIILSIILGILSFTFIERKVKGIYVFILFLSVLMASTAIYFNNGHFESRDKSQDVGNIFLHKYKNYDMDPTGLFEKCNASTQMQQTGQPEVEDICLSNIPGGIFLWGDSHMGALSTGLRHEVSSEVPFSQLTSSGCQPSFIIRTTGSGRMSRGCNYSNDMAYKAIQKVKPKVVILGAGSKHEKIDWQKTVDKLLELGVAKVIIIGPFPQWLPSLPNAYVTRHMGKEFMIDRSFDKSLIKSNNYLIELNQQNQNFIFLNVLEHLCENSKTDTPNCKVKIEGSLLAFDYGHLTVEGSRFVARNYLIPLLDEQ
jgi:peptidoglycan/LPS O-acetylase OafA/YrhL